MRLLVKSTHDHQDYFFLQCPELFTDVTVTGSEHSPLGTDIATDIGAGADRGETRPRRQARQWAASAGVKMLKSCTNTRPWLHKARTKWNI